MKKCCMSCSCSGTNRSTEHFQDYLAINDNELTLSVVLMFRHSMLLLIPYPFLSLSIGISLTYPNS